MKLAMSDAHAIISAMNKARDGTIVSNIKACYLGPKHCNVLSCNCDDPGGHIPWYRDMILSGVPLQEILDAIEENEDF